MIFMRGVIYTMKKLDNYYINRATCAIIPVDKEVCEVYELNDSYSVSSCAKRVIDDSCKYFGCTYHGRLEGSKKILNMNYKLPIIIEEFNNLIFFPTSSPRFGQCIWISLNNIRAYEKVGKNVKIIFNNGWELFLDISYYSLENQIFRATMLESLIRKRRNF